MRSNVQIKSLSQTFMPVQEVFFFFFVPFDYAKDIYNYKNLFVKPGFLSAEITVIDPKHRN
jgi:hypothetical protein